MATTRDPFEAYLLKAETLYQAGDVVQAGQIWQAILKKVPNHSDARAGLYKVKIYFDARATQDGMIPSDIDVQAQMTSVPVPAAPAPISKPDEIERLLRDGCTLFDMGQSEDALKKWEQILAYEPNHQLALAYIKDARQDLGLTGPGLVANPEPPPTAVQAPEPPVVQPPPAHQDMSEHLEQLLREGTQLYDMGMPDEAAEKWQHVLTLAPGHKDALAYLEMAMRERAAAPPPRAAAPAPKPPREDPEIKLRSAESLLHQGRLEESAFLFREVLNLSPQNFRALQGLHQTQSLIEARQHTHAAPPPEMYPPTPPVPWAPEQLNALDSGIPLDAGFESEQPAVQPPATVTAPAPPPRKGLEIPQLLKQLESEIPPWVKAPKVLASLAGVVILAYLIVLGFKSHRKDVLLANEVAKFRADSIVPAVGNLEAIDLAETPTEVRREAESLLDSEPLLAYYRGQVLIGLNPLDGPAAQLMGRAGQSMAKAFKASDGSIKEADKLLSSGDLEGAKRMLVHLLLSDPDNADLKARAARVSLALTEVYVIKERWGDAEDQLKFGRLMFPTDKSWRLRLQFLGHIKGLRAEERKPWIQLMG